MAIDDISVVGKSKGMRYLQLNLDMSVLVIIFSLPYLGKEAHNVTNTNHRLLGMVE